MFSTLVKLVMASSKAKTFNEARAEWQLDYVEYARKDEMKECACGHFPIRELCHLKNLETGNALVVGNCCVHLFNPELKTKKLFEGIKSLFRGRIPNKATLEYFKNNGALNDWEYAFLLDVRHKRKLTAKQTKKYVEIISNLVFFFRRSGGASP